MTLSLTSRISLSLPTSRRGRNTVGLGFGSFALTCSEMLTRHYRLHDDALATPRWRSGADVPFVVGDRARGCCPRE